MSLFFRGERRSGTLASANATWSGGDAFPALGDVSVERAQRLSSVFAALRHIVDFGSTLPVNAFRVDSNDQSTKIPLPQFLRVENEPGGYGVGQWIGQALYGLATRGNAVGWIADTDGYGFPTKVRWIRGKWWSFNELTHQWYVLGEPVPASRIFHIPWIVPDGFTLGLSPIEHYAQLVRTGLSAQEYADIRRGGGIPPTMLKNSARTVDKGSADRISNQAAKSFMTGKPFVTGMDWDLSVPSIPPSHKQFIDTMRLTGQQIAAIYGIDPREIGGDNGSGSITYRTDESRALNRAQDMRPYLERVEAAVSLHMPSSQIIQMDVGATMRTDMLTQTNIIGLKMADGRLSLNEARAIDHLPPVPGGDVHLLPQPMTVMSPTEGIKDNENLKGQGNE